MEAKLKHLEFLQNIITRMANNSFLLKGWAITLVVAIFGLNKDDIDFKVVFIALFLTLMFWVSDAYFLSQERYFRGRYDEISKKESSKIDFSMKLEQEPSSEMDWFVSMMSVTLRLHYGILLGAILIFGYFV